MASFRFVLAILAFSIFHVALAARPHITSYPIMFTYACNNTHDNIYRCDSPFGRCYNKLDCKHSIQHTFNSKRIAGVAATRLTGNSSCETSNKPYFNLFKRKNIRFCNGTAPDYSDSSDLACMDKIRCRGVRQCAHAVCSLLKNLSYYFLIMLEPRN